MWAARPHLANIFEKLLDQKTFVCLRLIGCNHLKNNLLRKCGLLAHTSAAFLKIAAPKNFLFACGSFLAAHSEIVLFLTNHFLQIGNNC